MSRQERDSSPIQIVYSKFVPRERGESPDLLSRYSDVNLLHNAELNENSPANLTDIILSDDDTESLNSNTTLILEPDIIVDHVKKGSSIKNNELRQEEQGFLRCIPLEDLITSTSNVQTSKEFTSECNSKSNNDKCKRRSIMKNMTKYEATSPTSDSDDDFSAKKNVRIVKKSCSGIRNSQDPHALSSLPKKPSHKYILDKDYIVRRHVKNPIKKLAQKTYPKKQTTKTIKPLTKGENHIDYSDVNNAAMRRSGRLKSRKVLNRILDSDEEEEDKMPSEIMLENSYERWMRRYPDIKKNISKNYEIRTGTAYREWEEIGMIWYLLETRNIICAGSRKTWAEMIQKGYLKHRTMRSLHNHFIRKMLPNIRKYSLPDDIIEEFNAIIK